MGGLGQSFLGIVLTTILAVLFSGLVRQVTRDKYLPFVFAFMLWSDDAGRLFAKSFASYYGLFLMTFIAYAFVLSDIRVREIKRNTIFPFFVLFFGWFALASFWTPMYKMLAVKSWMLWLRIFLCGYAIGSWAIRTQNGVERLFRYSSVAVLFCVIPYLRYGNWSAAETADAGGRLMFDSDVMTLNINSIALYLSAVLPYPVIYALGNWHYRREKTFKIVAIVTVLILSLSILKTGARNGGLALVAVAGYLLFGKTGIKRWQRTLLIIGCSLTMIFFVSRFFAGSSMRAIEFLGERSQSSYSEDLGSGRVGFFLDIIHQMTPMECFIGAGTPLGQSVMDARIIQVSNRHSIYMQVFNQAGGIGIAFMLIFFLAFAIRQRRFGRNGQIALFCLSLWALTGVGEAANMILGLATYALGIGVSFCAKSIGYPDSSGLQRCNHYGTIGWR